MMTCSPYLHYCYCYLLVCSQSGQRNPLPQLFHIPLYGTAAVVKAELEGHLMLQSETHSARNIPRLEPHTHYTIQFQSQQAFLENRFNLPQITNVLSLSPKPPPKFSS